MNVPDDLAGIFWLPERPDQTIAGHLKHSREGDITLELHGSFAELAQLFGGMPRYPLIHGVGEGNFDLTLHGCFSSGSRIGAFAQERIWVGVAFVGARLTQ